MFSALLVNNENVDKSILINTLKQFTDFNVKETQTIDEALELFEKRYFEILFIDSSIELVDKLEKFKKNNPNLIIICIYDQYDQSLKESIFSIGVHDYVKSSTDQEILAQRISNYIELSRLNKEKLLHSNAINIFHENINSRYLTFKLNTSESKLALWDYFSSTYFEKYENISESIDLLYAFTSWMSLNHRECQVVKETDADDNMYLTLLPIDYMSEKVVNSIISKYSNKINYKISSHKFSIKMTKIQEKAKVSSTSKLDEETKNILSKSHIDKISATEFLESTPVEFVDKIEDLYELENGIDEALVNFEKKPSVETLQSISTSILEYVDMIELLVDFQHLSYALKTLAEVISNIPQDKLSSQKDVKKFTTLSLSLLNDLSSWRENIFIKQEANDIHYLDSSLLSSCLQIKAIFEEEIEEDEDDFELF